MDLKISKYVDGFYEPQLTELGETLLKQARLITLTRLLFIKEITFNGAKIHFQYFDFSIYDKNTTRKAYWDVEIVK